MIGGAVETYYRVIGQPVLKGAYQARLPDPRLARDQHDAAVAGLDLPPAPQQQVEFFIASDQRGQCLPAQRREAAFDSAGTDDSPHRNGFDQTLRNDSPGLGVIEQAAYEVAGARANHDRVGWRDRLELSG